VLVVMFLVPPTLAVCRESEDIKIIEKSGIIAGMEENQTQEQGDIKGFSLASVFITDGLKEAGIYVKKDKKLLKVREGDSLKGYTVKRIFKDKVVLARDGKEFVLKAFSGDKDRRARAMAEYVKIEKKVKESAIKKAYNKSTSGKLKSAVGQKNVSKRSVSRTNKPPVNFIDFLRRLARERRVHNGNKSKVQNPFIKLLERSRLQKSQEHGK